MIVVVNIVLAVLLDEFLKAADKEKYETFMERHITDGSASHFQGPLDPFLEYISQFYNWDELLARILEAFRLFDTDRDGEIDFDDVSEGLRRLALQPKVLRDRVAFGLAMREQTRVHACTHITRTTHSHRQTHRQFTHNTRKPLSNATHACNFERSLTFGLKSFLQIRL